MAIDSYDPKACTSTKNCSEQSGVENDHMNQSSLIRYHDVAEFRSEP